VNVTQIVNGIESELYTWTDETGAFTIGSESDPALDVYTEVLVSYSGYYTVSSVQAEPADLDLIDLGTFTLKSLPATTIVLKVNALLDYEPYVMYDLSALTFRVTNEEGTPVESTLQENTLILTADDGSTLDSNEPLFLTVTADSAAEAVAPSEPIEFYLRDNTVDVNLTSWGRISVTTGPVDIETDPGQYFWIYDSDGQLCYSDTLHYLNDNDTDRFTGESDLLPNGTYTVVLIDRTFPMENVSHLDILSDFGVISDIHYYSKTVTVTDGVTTALDGISVPSFMDNGGDDLFADMFESILIDTNHAKPIVGQVYYLYIDYELKEEYSDSSTKTFTVQLPRNTKLMSSYLPSGVGSAVMNETTCVATVNTTANNGRIYFELRSIEADALAVVNVTLSKGTDFGRPVSHKLPILSVSIEPYPADTTYYKEYWADVRSTPGTTVYLYKDGSLVGTETTNALGTATFQFSLADRNEFGSYWKPLDGTTWDLTAKSILDDRTVLETLSPVTVTYDPDPFDIRIKLPGTDFRGDPIFIYNDP